MELCCYMLRNIGNSGNRLINIPYSLFNCQPVGYLSGLCGVIVDLVLNYEHLWKPTVRLRDHRNAGAVNMTPVRISAISVELGEPASKANFDSSSDA